MKRCLPTDRGPAVLIDLENFLHDRYGLLSPKHARPFLTRALNLVESPGHCIAVAPARAIGHYAGLLHELSIPTAVVPVGRNSADHALLEQANHLASIGYRRFVVVSGDHIFTSLCRAYPTTVIVRKKMGCARQLRMAAECVLAA